MQSDPVIVFVIALTFFIFGFTGISAGVASIETNLCFLSFLLVVGSLIVSTNRDGQVSPPHT